MPAINANGIEIAYELYGADDAPVLLLVQGLGLPLTAWPPRFIELLVAAGFRVLTFDNRDIGHSTLLDDLPTPGLFMQVVKHACRLPVKAPYQLKDMMADAEALLAALRIRRAHVVGASMGGMIAQLLAIHAPDRVASLISLMSTTGNRRLPGPRSEVRRLMLQRPTNGSDAERRAYHRKLWPLIGSPDFPHTEAEIESFLERIFARGMPATGILRQTLAILAAPSRVRELRSLEVPTLVVHGDADPLVPVACGRDTADAIQGADLVVIEGMGHDMPDLLVPRLADLVVGHIERTAALSPDTAAA